MTCAQQLPSTFQVSMNRLITHSSSLARLLTAADQEFHIRCSLWVVMCTLLSVVPSNFFPHICFCFLLLIPDSGRDHSLGRIQNANSWTLQPEFVTQCLEDTVQEFTFTSVNKILGDAEANCLGTALWNTQVAMATKEQALDLLSSCVFHQHRFRQEQRSTLHTHTLWFLSCPCPE